MQNNVSSSKNVVINEMSGAKETQIFTTCTLQTDELPITKVIHTFEIHQSYLLSRQFVNFM
jgi:hypothetical protein